MGKWLMIFLVLMIVVGVLAAPFSAMAAGEEELKNILGEKEIDKSRIYGDIKQIIYFIYGVGGLVVLSSLIVAAVLLSTSGSNPSRRAAGFGALGMAALGGYVLVKAFDIASFLTTFAGTGG